MGFFYGGLRGTGAAGRGLAMSDDSMRYDRMVEEAMRGVVRSALERVAEEGLPGEHHFYITFRTGADGVEVPSHLQERYPDEMTIVLQHRFSDLEVGTSGFGVTLSFNDVPSRLIVPYGAITAFADPSVRFGFTFAAGDGEDGAGEGEEALETEAAAGAETAHEGADDAEAPGEAAGETVVSLDRFRKNKT
jgi:hypothetical protein